MATPVGPVTAAPPFRVSVLRGDTIESEHQVHAVVADREGRVVRSWGDPSRVALLRSAAKPFQALPLVEDGAADHLGLTDEELALCCASHNSEDAHVAVARSILAKAGASEEELVCGPHPPLLPGRGEALAASGIDLTPIYSNCSGKHAGMLALASFHGWPRSGYEQIDHPVQRRISREVSRWASMALGEMRHEIDGCGVPCFAVPVDRLARAAARLADASTRDGSPKRVVDAMCAWPFMVAGTGRACTELMRAAGGRIFAKVGAEGVYMAGDRQTGLGVGLKVEDGAWRAAPPAVAAVLDHVGALASEAREKLADFLQPMVTNTLGQTVGRLVVRL